MLMLIVMIWLWVCAQFYILYVLIVLVSICVTYYCILVRSPLGAAEGLSGEGTSDHLRLNTRNRAKDRIEQHVIYFECCSNIITGIGGWGDIKPSDTLHKRSMTLVVYAWATLLSFDVRAVPRTLCAWSRYGHEARGVWKIVSISHIPNALHKYLKVSNTWIWWITYACAVCCLTFLQNGLHNVKVNTSWQCLNKLVVVQCCIYEKMFDVTWFLPSIALGQFMWGIRFEHPKFSGASQEKYMFLYYHCWWCRCRRCRCGCCCCCYCYCCDSCSYCLVVLHISTVDVRTACHTCIDQRPLGRTCTECCSDS